MYDDGFTRVEGVPVDKYGVAVELEFEGAMLMSTPRGKAEPTDLLLALADAPTLMLMLSKT